MSSILSKLLNLAGNITGTLGIANGGTAVTSVTTAPAASSFAGWDANKNLSANSLIEGYTTTVTAAGTTTLTVASTKQQYFTGSTTQTVVLPVTSTLVNGQSFRIANNSSGVVTVQSSGANTVQALAASTTAICTVLSTSGTTAASWDVDYIAAAAGTVTSVAMTVPTFLSVSGSPISTSGTFGVTLSGTALPLLNGGTGQTTKAPAFDALQPMTTAGDLIYGGASGTGTRLAGATGVLHSTGAATPSWATIVNADVDAAAAIAGSKLQAVTASNAGVLSTGSDTIAGAKTFQGSTTCGTTTTDQVALAVFNTSSSSPVATIKNASTSAGSDGEQAVNIIKGTTNNSSGANVFIQFLINLGSTNSGYIATLAANSCTFFNGSDRRLKKDIATLPGAVDRLMRTRPVKFKWKADGADDYGFIAQELYDVFPECVAKEDDGLGDNVPATSKRAWHVADSKMIPYLVKAIQEQQQQINDLKKLIK